MAFVSNTVRIKVRKGGRGIDFYLNSNIFSSSSVIGFVCCCIFPLILFIAVFQCLKFKTNMKKGLSFFFLRRDHFRNIALTNDSLFRLLNEFK